MEEIIKGLTQEKTLIDVIWDQKVGIVTFLSGLTLLLTKKIKLALL